MNKFKRKREHELQLEPQLELQLELELDLQRKLRRELRRELERELEHELELRLELKLQLKLPLQLDLESNMKLDFIPNSTFNFNFAMNPIINSHSSVILDFDPDINFSSPLPQVQRDLALSGTWTFQGDIPWTQAAAASFT